MSPSQCGSLGDTPILGSLVPMLMIKAPGLQVHLHLQVLIVFNLVLHENAFSVVYEECISPAGEDPELDFGGHNPELDLGGHNYLFHVKVS